MAPQADQETDDDPTGAGAAALANVDRLRRLAQRLVDGRDQDGPWFMARVQEYVTCAAAGLTLAAAFGIRGKPEWWMTEVLQQRDRLLREIHKQHFKNSSCREAASRIQTAATRYISSGGWERHKAFIVPPASASALDRDLFRLLKLDSPFGKSTIRNALANGEAVAVGQLNTDARRDQEANHGTGKVETTERSP